MGIEGLIASAGIFLSVTSIVVALSKDMHDGQYVDRLRKQGFVFDYGTPRAIRLRSRLALFPLVLVIAYIIAAIAVFVAACYGSSCTSRIVGYVIHCMEIVGLVFVLYLVRLSVLVRQERSFE